MSISYTCSVYVVVDTDDGKVHSVTVDDGSATLLPATPGSGPGDPLAMSDEDAAVLDDKTAALAVSIAEDEEWPAWTIGQ